MDNGVDKPVEVGVGDEKVEKRVQTGSDESKDVEEVFEEAVDTNDHAFDQETKEASGLKFPGPSFIANVTASTSDSVTLSGLTTDRVLKHSLKNDKRFDLEQDHQN